MYGICNLTRAFISFLSFFVVYYNDFLDLKMIIMILLLEPGLNKEPGKVSVNQRNGKMSFFLGGGKMMTMSVWRIKKAAECNAPGRNVVLT